MGWEGPLRRTNIPVDNAGETEVKVNVRNITKHLRFEVAVQRFVDAA